eukprot:4759664-Heterocapsa_arctica.AAC.1
MLFTLLNDWFYHFGSYFAKPYQFLVTNLTVIARGLPDSPVPPLSAFGLLVSVSFGLRPPS